MAKKTALLLPSTAELLDGLGSRLRAARLRRGLTAKQVAERAGMSPMTLRGVERGGAGVTLGAYAAVMQVLGIERDLELLGHADPVGRELQDSALPERVRPAFAPAAAAAMKLAPPKPAPPAVPAKRSRASGGDWIRKGGFSTSDTLSALIKRPPAKTRR